MKDGGVDLEKFKLKNMRQVQSIVNQLVCSLSLAEDKIQFEHRDLHLGNILIKQIWIALKLMGRNSNLMKFNVVLLIILFQG